VKRYYNLR